MSRDIKVNTQDRAVNRSVIPRRHGQKPVQEQSRGVPVKSLPTSGSQKERKEVSSFSGFVFRCHTVLLFLKDGDNDMAMKKL